ncbi:MAG: thioredoxin fold domain-containing protein [Bacteroidetes bacterium]|nr:thioredoxin fold domain-containing protein [Bacteroidota bacterium]
MKRSLTQIFPFLLLAAVLMASGPRISSAQSPDQALMDSGELAPMLDWPSFPDALENAQESERIIIIDVWSETCGWCRKLQTEVYTKPDLQEFVLDNFELGRLDIDIQTDTLSYKGYTLSSQMLSSGFGATGTPTTIFLEPDGTYITRLQGFHAYEDFFDVLRFIGTESFREMSFDDFLASETR